MPKGAGPLPQTAHVVHRAHDSLKTNCCGPKLSLIFLSMLNSEPWLLAEGSSQQTSSLLLQIETEFELNYKIQSQVVEEGQGQLQPPLHGASLAPREHWAPGMKPHLSL